MSVTPEAMWSNSKVLSVENSSETTIPVAGIREVSITAADEIAELYTIDSNFRDNVKRYEHNVNVEITYAKFSLEFAQEWLGGEGSTATASQDSADPTLYQIEEVTPSAGGGFERTLAVDNVVIPEFNLSEATYGEFEEYSITGSGRQVSQLEDTSGA